MPKRRPLMQCMLCKELVEDILVHLQIMHPDHYEEPEVWPDGGLVIVDETLEPEDFETEGGER